MKLLFIRHGDPDYEHDTLTGKGEREAELLAKRMAGYGEAHVIRDIYVSSMGRARKTAQYSLEALKREPTAVYDWLREFGGTCVRPDRGEMFMCWDWLPQDWAADIRNFGKDTWRETETMLDPQATAVERYDYVTSELDALLARHGYERESKENGGFYYRAVEPNTDTLVFFCHFGVESVLLSHLTGISPMLLWHTTSAAPTSVTTVITEERRPGIAFWRINAYGDVSHLYAGGEEPSFSARFCECYENADERHD